MLAHVAPAHDFDFFAARHKSLLLTASLVTTLFPALFPTVAFVAFNALAAFCNFEFADHMVSFFEA